MNEMFDKEYYSIESQMERIKRNEFIAIKMEEFKLLFEKANNTIKPYWHLNKNEIDFENLPEKRPTFLIENEYDIYLVDLNELLSHLNCDSNKVYGKQSIWTEMHNENKITKVLIKWQNNEKLIPVILNIPSKDLILIQDGHHRLTVSNYLDSEKIPVIISKKFTRFFLEKFNSKVLKTK